MSTITANTLQSVDETHQVSVAELDVITQNIKSGAYADKTTSATDTTAGRLLKVGDFGLGGTPIVLTSSVDINTLTGCGFYYPNAACTNLPVADWGMLIHSGLTTGTATQTWVCLSSGLGRQGWSYSRASNIGVWSTWVRNWDSSNLVKTTSSADTTAGSLMKVGDFGLGISVLTADLNAAILPGFYKNAASCANAPTTGIGTTTVNSFDSGAVTQIWIERSSGDMYIRSIISYAPLTWGAWKLMVSIDPGTGVLSVTAFNATEINANFFSEKVQAATGSTVDVGLGSYITYTATGANTWSFTTAGINSGYAMSWTLELTNGGLGLQTFTGVKWPGGVAPTLTADGVDILVFTKLSTGVVRGYLAGADSK